MRSRNLFLVFVIAICVVATPFTSQGCAGNHQPPYKLDSGEQVVLTNNDNSIACSWETLLFFVNESLDDVLPYTKERSSDIDSMVMLHNKLEDAGIRTALVGVNVQDNNPFFTCVAVETSDRGLLFLTIIPQAIGDRLSCNQSEFIQLVYLEKGQKIGFVEAKFALSSSYSWYLDYLTKFYQAGDSSNYLEEFSKVIDDNYMRLNAIDKTNEEIMGYLEDPEYYTEARRLAFNHRVDRYNSYIDDFNAQIEDYNLELSQYNELAEGTSNVIYAIKEDYSYPFKVSIPPVNITAITPPEISSYKLPTQSYVDELIASGDSYNQIPKPSRQSTEKFERITDDNFVVNDFKLWW